MGVKPRTPGRYRDLAGKSSRRAPWNAEAWTETTRPGPKTPAWKIIALTIGLVVIFASLGLGFLWWSLSTFGEYGIALIAVVVLVVPPVAAFGWWAMGPVKRRPDANRADRT
jgi:hypothetical protein